MNTDLLERASLFADFTTEELTTLAQHLRRQQFVANETIFSEGSASQALYIIERGGVRLSAGPVFLATLGIGAIFGEADLFQGREHNVSAHTTSDTSLLTVSKHDLEQLVQENPAIGVKLSRRFGERIVQMLSYLRDVRLRQVVEFDSLSDDELTHIANQLSLASFHPNQPLFAAGDPVEDLFIIEEGLVRVQKQDHYIEIGPGELLGLMALLADKGHFDSVRAVSETLAWELSRTDFESLASTDADLRARLSQAQHSPLTTADRRLALERLRALPLFTDVNDEVLQETAQRLLLKHVPASQIVYREGDMGDALYLVDSGRVEIVSSAARNGEVLARIGTGGFFGEMALLTGRSRTTGARAVENTNLWALYRRDFDQLVSAHPSLGQALSRILKDRLAEVGDSFAERHLRPINLFNGFDKEQLEEVAEQLLPARYRRGEVVYSTGDPGDRLHLIEKGEVELIGPQGQVATLSDGDIFGETALLSGEAHQDSARALSDVELWQLSRDNFESLMLKYPIMGFNLSRELSRRLYRARPAVAEPTRIEAPQATVAVTPPSAVPLPPAPVRAQPTRRIARPQAVPVVGPRPGLFASLGLWYRGLSRGAKVRLVLVTLLLAWLIGIALPATVVKALQNATAGDSAMQTPHLAVASADNSLAPVAIALANRSVKQQGLAPTATYTPLPTNTPIPTDTPTPTPTPTDTPTPTNTPTNTPTPTLTATPTDTPVPPTATPRPRVKAVAPTATPKPAVQYSLIKMRRLDPCENRGKHDIYVRVVDAAGNGVNGVWLIQAPANNASQILDKKQTENKDYWILQREDGRADFGMYKHAEYMVYVSSDGVNPASTDIAAPLHSNFTDETQCAQGGGGNTLFHNSFEVVFQKNY